MGIIEANKHTLAADTEKRVWRRKVGSVELWSQGVHNVCSAPHCNLQYSTFVKMYQAHYHLYIKMVTIQIGNVWYNCYHFKAVVVRVMLYFIK